MTAAPRGPVERRIPEGDSRERLVCRDCGFIDYRNPRIVVGSVLRDDEGRFLLGRRAIEPRRGFWTLPAGYLETGESLAEGARREAQEEVGADITIGPLLALYEIPQIAQVQAIFRASLARPEFAPGPESLEARLFTWDDLPWDELAFTTVRWALHHDRSVDGLASFVPFGNAEVAPGSALGGM